MSHNSSYLNIAKNINKIKKEEKSSENLNLSNPGINLNASKISKLNNTNRLSRSIDNKNLSLDLISICSNNINDNTKNINDIN